MRGLNVSSIAPSELPTFGVNDYVVVTRRADNSRCLFRLNDHSRRLLNTAKRLGLVCSPGQSELEQSAFALVRELDAQPPVIPQRSTLLALTLRATQSGLWCDASDLTRCEASLEIVTVPKQEDAPVSLCFSDEARQVQSALGNVLGNSAWLAHRAAQTRGCFTALLQDAQGRVQGAPFANVFCVRGYTLFTPSLACGAFDGITRHSVLTLAAEAGYVTREQELTREMLLASDEVFITSSASGIVPVGQIDAIAVGDGRAGSVTQRLVERYQDVLFGTDCNHPEWLCLT